MAKEESCEEIQCPWGGATGVVRKWSCGCHEVSFTQRDDNCSSSAVFFSDLKRDCGKGGKTSTH